MVVSLYVSTGSFRAFHSKASGAGAELSYRLEYVALSPQGALLRIFITSCYEMLCGCLMFAFLLVPKLMRFKCGLQFARASFKCKFVIGLYPVKNRQLNEPTNV